ncbi:MAG: DUF4827 domain-containing protein [Alloprevotella sp.]|nr:DUF4827 domain-containing protein [Alloprevotella sp.]
MLTKFAKYILLTLAASFLFTACNDDISYAELRKREKRQIESFLQNGVRIHDDIADKDILNVPGPIKVISEETFKANDSVTNVDENEYVLFSGSGVYMQIVRKGTGEQIKRGETATVLCRYIEYSIASDSIISLNNNLTNETYPEVLTIKNTSGTFSASFVSGVMKTLYSNTTVPSGWLFPLNFIKIDRQDSAEAEIALVRLIVPSTEGQSDAYANTYPCFYEISFMRAR